LRHRRRLFHRRVPPAQAPLPGPLRQLPALPAQDGGPGAGVLAGFPAAVRPRDSGFGIREKRISCHPERSEGSAAPTTADPSLRSGCHEDDGQLSWRIPNPESRIPSPQPPARLFGILRPVQQQDDTMDLPSSPPWRTDRTLAWTAFNALQFAFTLAWTAIWISAALLVYAVLRDRHWPLRMASRCWAPGLIHG